MAKSVKDLPKEIQDVIDVKEWDMRTLQGVKRFQELKAKSLPSIAMNGELIFESIIPGQEDLSNEILRRYQNR